jgi:hypothetical protein
MLTGRALFNGETVSDVMAQVLTRELDFAQVPHQLQRLFRSCLQKDPKQRLKWIGDWRLLLDEPSADLPGAREANDCRGLLRPRDWLSRAGQHAVADRRQSKSFFAACRVLGAVVTTSRYPVLVHNGT